MQDTFSAIPEYQREPFNNVLQNPADFVFHPSHDTTFLGKVICFFTVDVRVSWDCYEPGTRLAFVHWAENYLPTAVVDGRMEIVPMTCLERLVKSRRAYWPNTPWYDVIECSRILCMCPTVPDFANDGVVPKPVKGRAVVKTGPQPGDKIVLRNSLARGFGRPSGAHQHSGQVLQGFA